MTAAAEKTNETLAFKADVAKLLHMMVHSVYNTPIGMSSCAS